jgi:hypothetical protein
VTQVQSGERAALGGWLAGIAAWLVPGLGHLILGKAGRGLLLGGAVFTMFLVGLLLGGHLFSLRNASEVGLLAYVYGFCDLGLGAVYFVCTLLGVAVTDRAHLATAEYGNIFMMIAGLLNFLSALDAFDLSVGRKA